MIAVSTAQSGSPRPSASAITSAPRAATVTRTPRPSSTLRESSQARIRFRKGIIRQQVQIRFATRVYRGLLGWADNMPAIAGETAGHFSAGLSYRLVPRRWRPSTADLKMLFRMRPSGGEAARRSPRQRKPFVFKARFKKLHGLAPTASRFLASDPVAPCDEFGGRAIEYTGPIAPGLLPEQANGGIPGRIATVGQPQPVRHETQQGPDRLAHRPRQMQDAAIGHHDEIELRDHRGGIRKVVQQWCEIDDASASGQAFELGCRWPLLQAVELDAGQREPLQERAKRRGAIAIAREFDVSRPDDADAQLASAQVHRIGEFRLAMQRRPQIRRPRD